MKLPSYLQRNRFGIYYFRRAVPHVLRPQVGKLEIIRSLRTRELRQAIWHGRALALQVESWFQTIETQMARKRSKPLTHRTELIVTIEEFPEGPRKKTIQLEPGDIEAMSPEQLAVVLHDSTTLPSAPPPTIVAGAPAAAQPAGPRLSELIKLFYADKEGEAHEGGGDWAVPESYRTKFRRLTEILGDLPCDQVTRESARHVRAQLKLLPADTSKYRDMNVQQMIGAQPSERLSSKSLKDHITLYSSLFAFARIEKKYRDENPFLGLRVADNVRDKDRRDMFTDEELARIFSGAVFTDWVFP